MGQVSGGADVWRRAGADMYEEVEAWLCLGHLFSIIYPGQVVTPQPLPYPLLNFLYLFICLFGGPNLPNTQSHRVQNKFVVLQHTIVAETY